MTRQSRSDGWQQSSLNNFGSEQSQSRSGSDMTRNRSTVSPEEASVDQLQAVARVGPTRAMRIRRDLGISSIRTLADCPIDKLQEVWSIGPHQSKVIQASATGWSNKYEEWVAEAMPDSIDELDGSRRVAVVADDALGTDRGTLDWFRRAGRDPVAMVDAALDMAGIDVDDDPIEIGIVEGTDLCGREVQEWYDRKLATGPLFGRTILPTFWSKYATVCSDDPDRGEGAPITPSDVPSPNVVRQDDIHWGHAAMERNQEICEWADEIVIVMDGPYADSLREMTDTAEGRYPGVECFTAFEPETWGENVDFEVFTPDRSQTIANTYRDQESDDQDPVVQHGGSDDDDSDGNDTEVSFPEYNAGWGEDPEFDDEDPASERSAFRLEPNDTDDGRETEESRNDIKQDDPGGKGQGKKKGGTSFLNG